MPGEERRLGGLGAAYDTSRAGYAPRVFDVLERRAGLAPGAAVIELGCGTGLATRPLVERGARVTAIDPDAGMLELAARHLRNAATFVCAGAESLPFADACFDLAVAAQAAHWFHEPDATREVLRVLRPGGQAAYLWKYPAPETPYTYLVDELLARLTGQEVRTVYAIGTVPDLLGPGWEGYRRVVLEQPVAYTVASYIGFISSRERIRQLAGDARDALLEELAGRLRELEPSGAFVERNLVYLVTARRPLA